jgi:hypothetical protein
LPPLASIMACTVPSPPSPLAACGIRRRENLAEAGLDFIGDGHRRQLSLKESGAMTIFIGGS